jgi:O-antigen/teichoic acid export membrane protein
MTIKNNLISLFKDSSIYGIGNAISKLFSLFTIPVIARYFSVKDFGIIDTSYVLASLVITLVVFGQDSAVARFFYEFDDIESKKKVVSQSLFIQVVSAIVIIPLIFYFAEILSTFYFSNSNCTEFVKIIIFQIPFGLVINFSGNLMKWNFMKWPFLFIQLGGTFFYFGLVYIGIKFFSFNVSDLLWTYLFMRVIIALIGLFLIRKWIVIRFFTFNLELSRELIKFGFPLGVMSVVYSVLPAIDRYFVINFIGIESLGLYSVGYKIAFFVQLPIVAFQTSWGPFYMSRYKQENSKELFQRILVIYTLGICFFVLALLLFRDHIISLLVGDKFLKSSYIIIPLVLAQLIPSISWILTIGIDIAKKTIWKVPSLILNIALTVLLLWLFIKPFGLLGVACAMLVTVLIVSVFEIFIAFKVSQINFNLIEIVRILSVFVALIFLSLVLDYFFGNMFITNFLILILFIWIGSYQIVGLKRVLSEIFPGIF